MKFCNGCNKEKDLSCFYKNKAKPDGLYPRCKQCVKNYRAKNSKKIKESISRTIDKNKKRDKSNIKGRVCKSCGIFKDKDLFWKDNSTFDGLCSRCIDCKKLESKTESFKVKRRKASKSWREKNLEKSRGYHNNWEKNKRNKDPSYKLRRNVMHAISSKIQGKFFDKQERLVKRIFDYLPYSIEELKTHIESKWEPWMSWDNYGRYSADCKTWQIDHIIPQSALPYKDFSDENFIKCWNLLNLQPLETIRNIKKGNKTSA